ncbi:MAG: DUF3800 domain-containing protein [Anaerolineae bacterium]|nr:DUF3800 domain-containing protein [Anaerolineae bacterium]
MSHGKDRALSVRHYFVDEAGDGTLFDRRGRITIGKEGCSRFFILGLLDVLKPEALAQDLEDLRAQLVADPYFCGVPSMQPAAKKTALAFHAKDDLPEVRREVFQLLLRHEVRFLAVVRDKHDLLEYVRQRNERDSAYRYQSNELYDYLVRRLFKTLLHKDDEYFIYFARRGKADRTAALLQALETARRRFTQQSGIVCGAPVHVIPSTPTRHSGLQAADYFLWALQRLYDHRDERYVQLLWPAFHLVHDLDDVRQTRYGVYYTQKKPLLLAALKESLGI